MKHTQTPWVAAVEISDGGGWKSPEQIVTISSGESVIAYYATSYCDFPSDEENAANAAFIVRAVNAHEGLVRALKLCAAVCAGETMDKNGLIAALEAARAALSAAKE